MKNKQTNIPDKLPSAAEAKAMRKRAAEYLAKRGDGLPWGEYHRRSLRGIGRNRDKK